MSRGLELLIAQTILQGFDAQYGRFLEVTLRRAFSTPSIAGYLTTAHYLLSGYLSSALSLNDDFVLSHVRWRKISSRNAGGRSFCTVC